MFLEWLLTFFPWFHAAWSLEPEDPQELDPMTFADLKKTLDADLSAQADDAATLKSAIAAKNTSDADVANATVAFSGAILAAPGSTVVDSSSSPVLLYTSGDGLSYKVSTAASINDPAPQAPAPTSTPTDTNASS